MTRRRAKEPVWLLRAVAEAVHYDQIVEHGGLPGLRDEPGLEAALARPRNKWLYEKVAMPALVTAYGFGIARSHPFNDGNKRTALLAMAVFAERNGYSIEATDPDIVETILSLADGKLSEAGLKAWVASKLKRRGRSGSV
ncbi:MAG: type II toxin-antitoxin system death-on-curing family toxin [Phycisphaerae bacterium]|nr:type II toxin-antitoxin system death-on-curing family toxin [Phycisphaerae bacterium]